MHAPQTDQFMGDALGETANGILAIPPAPHFQRLLHSTLKGMMSTLFVLQAFVSSC